MIWYLLPAGCALTRNVARKRATCIPPGTEMCNVLYYTFQDTHGESA